VCKSERAREREGPDALAHLGSKGMFDSVRKNGDDPTQAFGDGDTIGVLVDFLALQVAWFVNGKRLAHRCHLPLSHHESRDLRFMVAVRGAQVEMTPAEAAAKNLGKHVDYGEWLALSKADDDATVDQNTVPWLAI
jgi:hypothetical protein